MTIKENIILQKNAPIQVHRIENTGEFEKLRLDWTTLLSQNSTRDAFLTWEWNFAWWKCYGQGKELWLITAWKQNKLIGIAPLVLIKRKKFGIEFRILSSLGTYSLDVGGFIVQNNDQEIYSAICNYLIMNKNLWDLMELNEFAFNDPGTGFLKSIFLNLGWSIIQQDRLHYYLPIQDTWQDYLNQLSPNLRGDLRKKVHRIEKQGKLTYIHHHGPDVTRQDLVTIFKINAHGRYSTFYQSNEEKSFQKELCKLMSERGWFDVHFLFIDNHPVAYRSGFYFQNRFEDWRTGFNTKYYELSVGKVLLMFVIEDCFKQSSHEIDFLRGDEEYKLRWNTKERVFSCLRFINSHKPIHALIYILIPKIKMGMKKIIKKNGN